MARDGALETCTLRRKLPHFVWGKGQVQVSTGNPTQSGVLLPRPHVPLTFGALKPLLRNAQQHNSDNAGRSPSSTLKH